jgi:hypothetical protein
MRGDALEPQTARWTAVINFGWEVSEIDHTISSSTKFSFTDSRLSQRRRRFFYHRTTPDFIRKKRHTWIRVQRLGSKDTRLSPASHP